MPACPHRCLATGLTGQLLFKQGHRIKGSVSRMGMAGALLETAAVAGTWDGQVTVESVDIEAAGGQGSSTLDRSARQCTAHVHNPAAFQFGHGHPQRGGLADQ